MPFALEPDLFCKILRGLFSRLPRVSARHGSIADLGDGTFLEERGWDQSPASRPAHYCAGGRADRETARRVNVIQERPRSRGQSR
jgi:hypothetical protein